ncbi:MAG: hypothetical protein LBK92_02815 [Endomicrobium sp.]|jgi:hypothetical protein|nr:hypothetical protein [Endomicrobium sp.]
MKDRIQLIEEKIKKKKFEKLYTIEGPEMEKIEKELNELKKKYVDMILDNRT